MNNIHILKQEIELDPELPVLPPGVSYLLKALTNNNITYKQLATEIEKFPSIAVKIVATANSAWASPTTPITSLRDSCSRIGLPLVRSISIALSVSQIFIPTRCSSFDPKIFWISALLTAEAAYLYAKNTPDICPDTARLAGLLHNIGLLWLADKRPIETSDAIIISQEDDMNSLTQTLSEKYNIDLGNVNGYLATSMELPEITAFTIASCSMDNNSYDEPLIINHLHARKIASLILSHTNSNDTSYSDHSTHFLELTNKLPAIQSMAQVLFFN